MRTWGRAAGVGAEHGGWGPCRCTVLASAIGHRLGLPRKLRGPSRVRAEWELPWRCLGDPESEGGPAHVPAGAGAMPIERVVVLLNGHRRSPWTRGSITTSDMSCVLSTYLRPNAAKIRISSHRIAHVLETAFAILQWGSMQKQQSQNLKGEAATHAHSSNTEAGDAGDGARDTNHAPIQLACAKLIFCRRPRIAAPVLRSPARVRTAERTRVRRLAHTQHVDRPRCAALRCPRLRGRA
jgi:hypothetical protein